LATTWPAAKFSDDVGGTAAFEGYVLRKPLPVGPVAVRFTATAPTCPAGRPARLTTSTRRVSLRPKRLPPV
jgi:hypothetical protein